MVRFNIKSLEDAVNNITNSMSVSLDDNFKVLVFSCKDGVVRVGAYAYVTTLYTVVDAISVDYNGIFMVDAFKLRDILRNCHISNDIKVEYVDLIPSDLGVTVCIAEYGTGEYLEGYRKEITFNLPKITKPVDKRLNFDILDVDLDIIEFNSDEFLFMAKTLVPKIDNTDMNIPANYIFFEPSRIYTVTQTMVNILKNTVCENIDREFSLLGKVVDFLVKLLESTETKLGIVFQENLILFKTDNYIIVYNIPQMRSQKAVLDKLVNIQWDKAFVLDNVLLGATLKRASIMGDKLELKIDTSEIEVTVGNKFKNTLPLAKTNINESCSFVVNLKILENAILKNETYVIIYIKDGRLKILDTTKIWESYINYEDSLKL